MKYNTYQMVSELLTAMNGPHPNIDMLIVKPCLYTYVSNDKVEDAKENGLKPGEDKVIHAYFTRIPETVDMYSNYLKTHTPLKISISKLKGIKDQVVKIKPFNIENVGDTLNEDDIKKISKQNNLFFNYFTSSKDLSQIPHALIWVEKGILPSFVFKVIEPKIQNISEIKG